MGSGNSIANLQYSEESATIRRIPDEVPRRGRLRTVGSFGRLKNLVSGSSVRSIDPEQAERIKMEHEMYCRSKESEIINLQTHLTKLEIDNRRLCTELTAVRGTVEKLRQERDDAQQAEQNALKRATAFQLDRDKIQRQFKIFRETKEGEIQNLLRTRQDLEGILGRHVERRGSMECDLSDWSLDCQLTIAPASLGSENKFFVNNVVTIYLSCRPGRLRETFQTVYAPELQNLCHAHGRCLQLIFIDVCSRTLQLPKLVIASKIKKMKESVAFLAIVGTRMSSSQEEDFEIFIRLKCCCPALVAFKKSDRQGKVLHQVKQYLKQLKTHDCDIIDNFDDNELCLKKLFHFAMEHVSKELGASTPVTADLEILQQEGPEILCGGNLWDPKLNLEQVELQEKYASTKLQGMKKQIGALNDHLGCPGPVGPLIVLGTEGTGKSVLLTHWLSLLTSSHPNTLILSHFVPNRRCSSADGFNVVRRLMAQLLACVSWQPALPTSPKRLLAELPRWLDKLCTNISILLVLDSVDRIEEVTALMDWLLDPLPADLRVVISADPNSCPEVWKAWKSLSLTSSYSPKSALVSHQQNFNPIVSTAMEEFCHRLEGTEDLNGFLRDGGRSDSDVIEFIVDHVISKQNADVGSRRSLCLSLALVLSSRNGMSFSELQHLIPDSTHSPLLILLEGLVSCKIFLTISGLFIPRHDCVRSTLFKFCGREEFSESKCRAVLINFWAPLNNPRDISHRVADELPWLYAVEGDDENLYSTISDLCVFVKLYARGRCNEVLQYWRRFGKEKFAEIPSVYNKSLQNLQSMANQFQEVVTIARIADVYEAVGRFFRDMNFITESLRIWQKTLELRETTLDPDDPIIGQTLHHLASVYAQAEKYQTALVLYKQSLNIYQNMFGEKHPLVWKELMAMAHTYDQLGQVSKAEALRKQAGFSNTKMSSTVSLLTLNQNDSEMSLEKASSLNQLGLVHLLQASNSNAEAYFSQALDIRQKLLGSQSLEVAQSQCNLGTSLFNQGRQSAALALYEAALETRRKMLPTSHINIASLLSQIGSLYLKTKHYEKAEQAYREAIDILDESGEGLLVLALNDLALVKCQQGCSAEAQELLKRAISIQPKATSLTNLALINFEMGQLKEAAQFYKKAVQMTFTSDLADQTHL